MEFGVWRRFRVQGLGCRGVCAQGVPVKALVEHDGGWRPVPFCWSPAPVPTGAPSTLNPTKP